MTEPDRQHLTQENPLAETALFPIGTVSEQTGVNTVTLRAWERRYGLLKPQRTPKGHRLYTQQDIDQVRKILGLLKQGIAAGQVRDALKNGISIAPVPPDQSSLASKASWQELHKHFTACITHFDARALDAAFNDITRLYPLDIVAENLLIPLYRELLQQRQVLPSTGIDLVFLHDFLCARLGKRYFSQPVTNNARQHVLIGNLMETAGQFYSLLLANLLTSYGYKITWLSNMTIDNVPLVCQRTMPDAMILLDQSQEDIGLPTVATFLNIPVFLYAFDAPLSELLTSQQSPGIHLLRGNPGDIPAQVQDILDHHYNKSL